MASAFGSGDPAPRRSVDRVRVIVYPALVLLAVGALALRAGWINTRATAGSPNYVQLRGLTAERQPMTVWLDGTGRVHELAVKLIGLCENGGSDPLGWSPESPRITFGATAGAIFAREYNSVRPVGGVPSHSVVWTTARFGKGDSYASGDARFETTWVYPDGRRLRCDSGYVHWAVNRAGTANGSFAPVSSLAVGAPPAQLRFAALVDQTCETTYEEGAERQLRRDREDQPLIKRQRSVLADHDRQYRAIARLGEPLDGGRRLPRLALQHARTDPARSAGAQPAGRREQAALGSDACTRGLSEDRGQCARPGIRAAGLHLQWPADLQRKPGGDPRADSLQLSVRVGLNRETPHARTTEAPGPPSSRSSRGVRYLAGRTAKARVTGAERPPASLALRIAL